MTSQTLRARHRKTLALAALLAGMAVQAHAGFVLGRPVTGLATDNLFPATIFSGDALIIGTGAEFTGIQEDAVVCRGVRQAGPQWPGTGMSHHSTKASAC